MFIQVEHLRVSFKIGLQFIFIYHTMILQDTFSREDGVSFEEVFGICDVPWRGNGDYFRHS